MPNYDYCLIGYIGFKNGYLLNFKVKVLFPGFLLEKTEFFLTYQTKPKAVKHLLKQNWKSPLALTVLQYTRLVLINCNKWSETDAGKLFLYTVNTALHVSTKFFEKLPKKLPDRFMNSFETAPAVT